MRRAVLIAALGVLLAAPAQAFAHAQLEGTSPLRDAALDGPP